MNSHFIERLVKRSLNEENAVSIKPATTPEQQHIPLARAEPQSLRKYLFSRLSEKDAKVDPLGTEQKPLLTLPGFKRHMHVSPFRQPIIDRVEPQILEWTANAKLTITGRNLKAERVHVRFGKLEPIAPKTEDITDCQILIALPDELTAGINPVKIIHQLVFGKPPDVQHQGCESNVATSVLAPKITTVNTISAMVGSELTIEFEPAVTPGQKVAVLIGDCCLPIPLRDSKSSPVKNLSVKIPEDFPVGDYMLRLRVDGAESLLKVDRGRFVGPKVRVGRS